MSNNLILDKKPFYGFISAVFLSYLAITLQYSNKQFMEKNNHDIEKWVTYTSTLLYIFGNIIIWIVLVFTQKNLKNNNFYFWIITVLCFTELVNGVMAHYIRSYNLDKNPKFKNIIKVNYALYILLYGSIFSITAYYKPKARWLLFTGYILICINFVWIEPYQRKNKIVDGPSYFIVLMAWFLLTLGISIN